MKKKFFLGGLFFIIVVVFGFSLWGRESPINTSYEQIGFLRGVYFEQQKPLLIFDDATVIFSDCGNNCPFDRGVKNIPLKSSVRFESDSTGIVKLSPKKLNQLIIDGGAELQKTTFILLIGDDKIISIKETSQ